MNDQKITDIKKWQKEKFGEIFKRYVTSSWYFETAREKIILMIITICGWWKILEIIGRLF